MVKALQMKIFNSSPNGIQIAQKSKPILQANRFHFYFQCQCTGSLFDSLSTRPDGWALFLLQMKKAMRKSRNANKKQRRKRETSGIGN